MSDDLTIDTDRLLGNLQRWKSEDADRASSAGETRQEIGAYLDATGINKKALAMVRALDKMKDDKRQDALRSLDALLDVIRPHWNGQSTPDMLDGHDDAAEPVGDGEGGPEEVEVSGFDPDAETAEFDAAADAVAAQ